jgi:hypothetical protein
MFYTHEDAEREFGYHPATDVTGPAHDRVRLALRSTAHQLLDLLPEGPRKTEAIGHLRTAMWAANSAVATTAASDPEWQAMMRDKIMSSGEGHGWDFSDPAQMIEFAWLLLSSVHEWRDQTPDWQESMRRFQAAYTDFIAGERRYVPVDPDAVRTVQYADTSAGRSLQGRDNVLATITNLELGAIRRMREQGAASPQDVARTVFEHLGAASACWENLAGAGVFQSEECARVGRSLLTALGFEIPEGYQDRDAVASVAAGRTAGRIAAGRAAGVDEATGLLSGPLPATADLEAGEREGHQDAA